MKNQFILLLLFIFFISCKPTQSDFNSVKIDTLLTDKISIRAITVTQDTVWYAADKNRVGCINLKDFSKKELKVNKEDSLNFEFRSIAQTKNFIYILNVGNPAIIYKFSKDLKAKYELYEDHNSKTFYDSMQFWNDNEGIAIGDPIDNCLSVLITRNAGLSWLKVSCDNLPQIVEGEAAFAASNTNIIIKGNSTWIVTGGKKARVFYSPDKGNNWKVYTTPIVQGETMTGIFTSDFYNNKIGFIAGGNYEKPQQNFGNKASTSDGGNTWELVAENNAFGYTSCIQYVPNSKGKQLVSVGTSGVYYSKNYGKSWIQLSTDANLYTIRFINQNTAIAAGKDKIIKLVFYSK